jgi:cytochrome P450
MSNPAADAALAAIFAPTQAQRDDPYPLYRALREAAPVHKAHIDDEFEPWVCSRFDDVAHVLGHRAASTRPDLEGGWGDATPEEAAGVLQIMSRVLLFMDAPEHTRIRRLVNKAFTPRAVERLRARVAEVSNELIDGIAERGGGELIEDFAFPLPVIVIADMLGVPASDHPEFRTQIPKLTPLLELGTGPEAMATAGEAMWFFAAYFLPLFEQRRAEPTDDLISALVHAEVDGETLDPMDALVTCILLLGAGHETTMNLLGNGLLALLREPDQLALVRDGAVAPTDVVEELLRFDPTVQLTVRRALEDIEVDGHTIDAGTEILLLLAAANHDPAHFEDPDRLDVTRADVRHLAFGHGPHYCLGAALARLEAEIAVPLLLRRLPDLRLAGEAHFRPTNTLRGLTALPLACTPAPVAAASSPV